MQILEDLMLRCVIFNLLFESMRNSQGARWYCRRPSVTWWSCVINVNVVSCHMWTCGKIIITNVLAIIIINNNINRLCDVKWLKTLPRAWFLIFTYYRLTAETFITTVGYPSVHPPVLRLPNFYNIHARRLKFGMDVN